MKTVAKISSLLLALWPLAAAAQMHEVRVLVPGGMLVPVKVLGSLSSANEKAGDTFQVQAANDVVVNGMIVIQAGAEGQGTIQQVDSAGGNGHSGALALNFDYIYSVDGGKIRLSNGAQKHSEEDRKGASSTATIVGVATLGIGGIFGHNFAKGKDVVIDGSRPLSAFVDRNVHVRSTQRAVSQDNYDR